MSSQEVEATPLDNLPRYICANPREIIEAEETTIDDLIKDPKSKRTIQEPSCLNVWLRDPVPSHSLTLTWSPDQLYFEINDEVIEQKLWIWNTCDRTIYFHCCQLCGENASRGAKWKLYPKTRFHLAPGLRGEINVRATPTEDCSMPCARASIQLAAAHMRDVVIGYFAVPILVKFCNYIPFETEEG